MAKYLIRLNFVNALWFYKLRYIFVHCVQRFGLSEILSAYVTIVIPCRHSSGIGRSLGNGGGGGGGGANFGDEHC